MRRALFVLGLNLLSACSSSDPPALVVVSAKEEGVVPRTEAIQGRDGGPSGLAFGRSAWTYGDTVHEMPDEDGTNWHTNSFGHADPAAWRDGFTEPMDSVGAPRFFVELTDEEKEWDRVHAPEQCEAPPCHVRWALWPSAPLFDEASGRAWILYGLYNEHNPSGIGVASWDGLDKPVVRHRIGESWLLFPKPEPEWANAPVVHDGHLYAFGCVPDGLSRPCSLARVPLSAVDDRAAWTFFDGETYGSDMAAASVLFEGAPIMNVAWSAALSRWLLVYSPSFDQSVVARTASSLEGPWSEPGVLFTVDTQAPYDAVHHAEIAEDNGAVHFVTYSRSTNQGWFGAEHAVWRVELAPAQTTQ
jgi:hypothetical protein